MSVAGILLAAGAGRRYGMPKALVRHGDSLLVEHAVRTLREGGCVPIVVVLGAAADEVRQRATLGDATVVDNADWATGMGSSLRAGLSTVAALSAVPVTEVAGPDAVADRDVADPDVADPDAVAGREAMAGRDAPGREVVATVVLLVDTPGVTPAAVTRLAEDASPDRLAVATYQGERGHPVLLGRRHWDGVMESAVADMGARRYLARHQVIEVPCDDIADGTDLDRPPEEQPPSRR
ncbi:MAG: nucleotidyltransferase family protein [Micromonosporaceae bacterium]